MEATASHPARLNDSTPEHPEHPAARPPGQGPRDVGGKGGRRPTAEIRAGRTIPLHQQQWAAATVPGDRQHDPAAQGPSADLCCPPSHAAAMMGRVGRGRVASRTFALAWHRKQTERFKLLPRRARQGRGARHSLAHDSGGPPTPGSREKAAVERALGAWAALREERESQLRKTALQRHRRHRSARSAPAGGLALAACPPIGPGRRFRAGGTTPGPRPPAPRDARGGAAASGERLVVVGERRSRGSAGPQAAAHTRRLTCCPCCTCKHGWGARGTTRGSGFRHGGRG